jgi:hypothetical protein
VESHSRTLAIITLIIWLFTAGVGAYMFHTLASHGGLRRQRTIRDGLPPAALFAHFGLALTALVVWASYVAIGWAALAWAAVGLLMPAIGLGICTVTLWTPFPGPGAGPADGTPAGPKGAPASTLPGPVAPRAVTDDMLVRALTDEVLAAKLIDQVIANAAAGPSRSVRRPKVPVVVLIPVAHGVAALATFALAVITATGTR